MKQISHSLFMKALAVVLTVVFFLGLCCSLAGFAYAYAYGFYSDSVRHAEFYETNWCDSLMLEQSLTAFVDYSAGETPKMPEGFVYSIVDDKDALLAGAPLADLTSDAVFPRVFSAPFLFESASGGERLTVKSALSRTLSSGSPFYAPYRIHGLVEYYRFVLIAVGAGCFFACLLLVIFLCGAAGKREGSAEIRRSFFDRIPADLFLVLCGFLLYGAGALLYSVLDSSAGFGLTIALCALAAALLPLFGLFILMSLAVRVKTKTLWKHTVIFVCLSLVWRLVRAVFLALSRVAASIPALWKLLLCMAAYALFSVLALTGRDSGAAALWLLVSGTGAVIVCLRSLEWKRLFEGGKRLAEGDLSDQIDETNLHGEFRLHAKSLNSIAVGMGRAVDARIKSERMKTDLITNVSHDLKTPLTSIVNYVDLLKKEDLHNETAAGYVEVLDRQAERLKKLTVDLVDASKVQSGVMQATLMPTDLSELLSQCAAEYEERFRAADLTPVLTLPETPLTAIADGRLLFRVLDNLLMNAVKYAQPGTRVYIDGAERDGKAVLSIRNVSREMLHIDVAELRERFVRGDTARTTEGSGLGLSIADGLMTLMGGALVLTIDGDLFRADAVL